MKATVKSLERRAQAVMQRKGSTIPDETRAEIEAWWRSKMAEYDAPEAVAERKRQYDEISQLGALRKSAFERGESMDAVAPLPWTNQKPCDPHEFDGMTVPERLDVFCKGGF